jgi:hypothetical protein
MHQSSAMSHGFNHQSSYRQPALNLRPINQLVSNGNYYDQNAGFVISTGGSNNAYQENTSNRVDREHTTQLPLLNNVRQQLTSGRNPVEVHEPSRTAINNHQGIRSTNDEYIPMRNVNAVERREHLRFDSSVLS